MAKDLVVVTGVNGFVGIHATVLALEAGYRVRGTLRREDQIARIKALPQIQPYLDDIEFAIVTNIGSEDAFNAVLDGATYVLHIASPLPTETVDHFEEKIVKPAVQGTVGLLKRAQEVKTIKRVVITSSQVALIPAMVLAGLGGDPATVYNEESRVYNPPITNNRTAYPASKALAFAATLDFIEKSKPHFDVITLQPGPILGPGLLFAKPDDLDSGMNSYVSIQLLGKPVKPKAINVSMHVVDLAKLHILALDPRIEGNQNFVCAPDGLAKIQWNEVIPIAKKYFPNEIEQGIIKLSEGQETADILIDGSKVERVFGELAGFKYTSFEQTVRDIAQQIVDLSK